AMAAGRSHDPLAVLVSGGHTAIAVHLNKRWRIYGETEDITLGNLLDMFAREAKLPSPGGVAVESKAKEGRTLLALPYTVKGNDPIGRRGSRSNISSRSDRVLWRLRRADRLLGKTRLRIRRHCPRPRKLCQSAMASG